VSVAVPERTAYVAGRLRGIRYGEVPGELERALEVCLEGRDPPGGDALKPGFVWRIGSWCVKRFEPRSGLRRIVESSPAARSAELHFALPVRTPRPLAHVERDAGRGGSLLVSEFVEGRFLIRSWREDPAARAALPAMLAALNRPGWFHGDLHARNLLWSGREWVCIDLAAIRPRLHAMLRRRRVIDEWGRVACALGADEGVRAAFERYLETLGLSWDRERAWSRVAELARELAPSWAPDRR
jgi:hypothetical protein